VIYLYFKTKKIKKKKKKKTPPNKKKKKKKKNHPLKERNQNPSQIFIYITLVTNLSSLGFRV